MPDIDFPDSSKGDETFPAMPCAGAGDAPKHGLMCPGNEMMAAYVDGGLSQSKRERLQRHLARCGHCRSIVADVIKLQREIELPATPFDTARRPLVFAPEEPKRAPWIWASATAMALLVLIAVFLGAGRKPQNFPAGSSPVPAAALIAKAEPPRRAIAPVPEVTRKLFRIPAIAPVILFPSQDSAIARKQLQIRWKPLSRSRDYKISLVTSEGDLLWEGQTKRSSLRLPSDLVLEHGSYFVWITAYLTDGQVTKSSPVRFVVER